ncbi:MAG: MarR family transcriptional regulator [Flavobacteriales bacterium]|nr:MarR family transcriptional regulator [Flavobacteriales bacterium]
MKPEETIDFHIRWTWAKISRMYNIEASKNGGTMSIGYVLLNIDKEGTPSTQLGPRMGMEPTSLSRVLNTMEDQKLIVRRVDNKDRRVSRVFLTKKGEQMREVSKGVVIKFNEKIRERISGKKLDAFFDVMQSISLILESEELFESKHLAS